MKRAFDILASAVGLVVAAPICLAIALAIVLESGRPALFSQMRVGRHGHLFRIFKFRTMQPAQKTAPLTVEGDPRITRLGAFLRSTKLDELPQLWNVLRGDMSIVGPRPELPRFVSQFSERYRLLLSVRPGMVDPASLIFHDESKKLAASAHPETTYVNEILPEKLALSTRYLCDRNLITDLSIIVRAMALTGRSLLR